MVSEVVASDYLISEKGSPNWPLATYHFFDQIISHLPFENSHLSLRYAFTLFLDKTRARANNA
jgi:hypothetical protein